VIFRLLTVETGYKELHILRASKWYLRATSKEKTIINFMFFKNPFKTWDLKLRRIYL
jgi:hypothetical protein